MISQTFSMLIVCDDAIVNVMKNFSDGSFLSQVNYSSAESLQAFGRFIAQFSKILKAR